MAPIRIDKYVASCLGVSRTDAKLLIKSGKITVNGAKVQKSDTKIENDDIVKNGEENLIYKEYVYLLMNKPEGILSASSDKRVKTVIDILPQELKRNGLFPVGRLDKNTTGLLIISDDGDFGHKIISPKSHIEKSYLVWLDGEVKKEHIKIFEDGVTLADGERCMPAKLDIIDTNTAKVTICEGKYHQIKRMFGIVGLGVNKLHRISIGKLVLPNDLEAGECRELRAEELENIFK